MRETPSTQRYYACGRLMQLFSAEESVRSSRSGQIHPRLTSFVDEFCATVARLFAHVGVVALFGILAIQAWDGLQIDLAADTSPPQGWSLADWSYSAFALSPPDAADKTEKPDTYVTLRHPGGGRKDILRWSRSGEKPAAELEIYRPGSEYGPASAARAELAARLMAGVTELEAAGVIASKFGSVALLRPAGEREGSGSCLGFLKRIDDPVLQMSGWSCQGDSLPARRAAIDCMLNRLVLLASGNEAKLADAFARAELNRGACASATVSADWMTEAANPSLRGAF
jgi:hypothetical protein